MNVTELSIKRPTLVFVVFAMLTFLGIMSYRDLNYELFPKFSPPAFMIVTPYPGAGPVEVQNNVSVKIEDALGSLQGVGSLKSISSEGVSMVIVSTSDATADIDPMISEAIRKVQAARSEMPPQAGEPAFEKFTLDDLPILTVGVSSEMASTELCALLKKRIVPELVKIPGVAGVTLLGEIQREIHVNVDRDKLVRAGSTLDEVNAAIASASRNFPTGSLENESGKILLHLDSRAASVDDLRGLVLHTNADGSMVHLQEVAEVEDGFHDPTTLYRVNGVQAVAIQVRKQGSANTVKVCDQVKAALEPFAGEFRGSGLSFTFPQDGSVVIRNAIESVEFDLVAAIVLVFLIMVLFLHDARNAFVVSVSVPVSILTSFIGMRYFGYSLNLMTLLGMSLVIGTLVDDAVVVIENIHRHLEMGKDRIRSVVDGVREIGMSVFSISIVLVVVFLPIVVAKSFVTPVIGPFAMVVVISVMTSFFVAMTLVPFLASRMARIGTIRGTSIGGRILVGFENVLGVVRDAILAALRWGMVHRWKTIALSFLLFASSIALVGAGFIGSEFASGGDVAEFILKVEYPKNCTLKRNNLLTRRVEEAIEGRKEIVGIHTTIGSGGDELSNGSNVSQIDVHLVDRAQRDKSSLVVSKEIERSLRETFPEARFEASTVSLFGMAEDAPIQIILKSHDGKALGAFASEVVQDLSRIPGLANVKISNMEQTPQVAIVPNRRLMAQFGVSMDAFASTLQTAFGGNTDNKLVQGDEDHVVSVSLDRFDRRSVDDVQALPIAVASGGSVRVGQVATVREELAPSSLERVDRMSSTLVSAQVVGRSSGDAGDDIVGLFTRLKIPDGVSYQFDGDLKMQDDSFGPLGTGMLVAIVLVYLLLVGLYGSFLHPFVVMFSVPFSFVGALWALALAGQTLSIFSILGMIMLVGLVIKNAILVVDFANKSREAGMPAEAALLHAVELRMRPILMTAGATIIGMLPIALSSGVGSEWKSSIGWVLIGGMTSSMFLSLVVVPVIYLQTERIRDRLVGFARRVASTGVNDAGAQ